MLNLTLGCLVMGLLFAVCGLVSGSLVWAALWLGAMAVLYVGFVAHCLFFRK